MAQIEVFADITCPFTHVGLHRFVEERSSRGVDQPRLVVRSWPLELVNGAHFTGAELVPKIEALRASVAPDLFAGFDPETFPRTSLPALDLAAAARSVGPEVGEQVSLLLRTRLFEDGLDISDPDVLASIADEVGGVPMSGTERQAVIADWEEGQRRGVVGSPFFFLDGEGFFCPWLAISHGDDGYQIAYDEDSYRTFVTRTLG